MKNTNRFVLSLVAATILASSPVMTLAQQTQNTPAQYNGPFVGTPEQEQAYKDGMEAAKLDTLAKRVIDPTASHLYKNPPSRVKKDQRDSYRTAFTAGYNKALDQAKANGGF